MVVCHDLNQSGSGFFVDNQGYFITNNHVVSKINIDANGVIRVDYSTDICVKVNDRRYAASLAIDQNADRPVVYDYAVLRVSMEPLSKLEAATSDVRQGDDVFAIGYPLGHDDPIITKGVVSAIISRPSHRNALHRMKTILTDTLITYGNSGGPLIRASDGKVIGISTMPHEIGAEIRNRLQTYLDESTANPIISDLIRFSLAFVNVGLNYAISIEHAMSDPSLDQR